VETPKGAAYLLDERFLSIDEVSKRYKIHRSAIYRWFHDGLCNGRVKLEVCPVGHRWFTSEEALIRFHDRVAAIRLGQPSGPDTQPIRRRTATQRAKDSAAAARACEQLGV
jgi:predicted DNA-binding transcriptional regulator AlpA